MTKSVTKIQDKEGNKRLSVVRSTDDPTKYGVVILNPDGSKIKGPKGDAATISVGSTTTGEPGTDASVVNSGTSSDAVLDFTIPKGEKGDTGNTGTISVGTTTTGNPGTNASVTNSGTSTAAILNFTIPRGDKGDTGNTGTISVGSTTTGNPGTNANVTNSGISTAAVFNFTIPRGDKGETGNGIDTVTSEKVGKVTTVTIEDTEGNDYSFSVSDGQDGEGAGDVLGPASSVDGDVVLFDGITGKLIKDSGKGLSDFVQTSGNQSIAGTKTFTTSPVVPSKSTDVGNNPTTIATEAQVKKVKDAIPIVVDNLESTSTTSALSANQGRVLEGRISTVEARGRFLSNWNATTGLPVSFPENIPYTYSTGDYFDVTVVSSANPPVNYRPNGSSYTGTASSTVETDDLAIGDTYIYDGTNWLLQQNHNITTSFSSISGEPTDNLNLATALGDKQDKLIAGSNITIGSDGKTISATDTTYNIATSSTGGLVKLGSDTVQTEIAQSPSSTAGKTYPIQLNSSNQAVVNVPWNNTTYNAATSSVAGLVKLGSDTVQSVNAETVSGTVGRTYAIQNDGNGNMVVNVPRQDTTYSQGSGILIEGGEISNSGVTSINGSSGAVTGILTSSNISDTAFDASWDGDTTNAPSKNAIYDVLGDVETLLANL